MERKRKRKKRGGIRPCQSKCTSFFQGLGTTKSFRIKITTDAIGEEGGEGERASFRGSRGGEQKNPSNTILMFRGNLFASRTQGPPVRGEGSKYVEMN